MNLKNWNKLVLISSIVLLGSVVNSSEINPGELPLPLKPVQVKQDKQHVQLPSRSESRLKGFKIVKNLGKFKMSFYSLDRRCVGESEGYGKSGRKVIPFKSVAVNPKVIPLDTFLYIEGYGVVQIDDTGSKVKGRKIDLFTNWSYEKMMQEGIKNVNVYLLERVK